jgi:hypothetical protein
MRSYLFIILFLTFLSAELIRPENDSQISYTHVLFEWDQAVDAVSYEIQVSTDNLFQNVLLSESVSSLIYIDKGHLDWDSQYYWKIRPIYSNGASGDWTSEKTFSILSSVTDPTINLYDDEAYQEGVTFLGSLDGNFSVAFDKDGNEIWNTQDNNIIMYNTNLKGELYGCHYNPQLENSYPGIELDINSNYIWEEPNDEFVHHELLRLPDGNYLGIAESIQNLPVPETGPWYGACIGMFGAAMCNGNNFPWVGDKLIIWDEDTKEIVWEWDTFDYYSPNDYDGVYYDDGVYAGSWDLAFNLFRYDWTHVNAASYSVEESAIYISCRHLSRLTKIYFNFNDYSDSDNGNIIWNLGQQMPSGEVHCGHDLDFSWQHSISSLDNGNIVTLDNGNLSDDFNSSLEHPISRAIEIAPNETADGCNAEIVWEYNLDEELFGHASGGVQKLDNGNYLISTVGDGGTTLEISDNLDLIWEAKYNLNLGLIHRAYRASSLYPIEASVIANGYSSIDSFYNAEEGIYVFFQDSVRADFTIYNNGSIDEEFVYSFESTSEDIWYPYTERSIQINAGESKVVTLAGHFNSNDEGGLDFNNVHMVLQSQNNHNIKKNYNFTMYAIWDHLSNDLIVDSYEFINAYPNPFNPYVVIELQIKEMINNADLNIYDLNGKVTENIYSGSFNPGKYSYRWTPQNLSSGKYFVSFESTNISSVKELIYIK